MVISFFFNDTATTEIYTLSLHDALPILLLVATVDGIGAAPVPVEIERPVDAALVDLVSLIRPPVSLRRSEEHTSELQSRQYFVRRLLIENKTNFVCTNH